MVGVRGVFLLVFLAGVAGGEQAIAWEGDLAGDEEQAEQAFFETHIRPLFANHCFECHGSATQEGGLRLDEPAALLRGGKAGPVIFGGKPAASLLLTAIQYGDPDLQMPPAGKLSSAQIAAVTRWIERGAHVPNHGQRAAPTPEPSSTKSTDHWAFQPIAKPVLPSVRDQSWPISPVDRFILARLESAGLAPAPPADKYTLLRRVTYDLTGLPPTPEEVEQFITDNAEDAYERLIDRLLASPRHGERWGRHWLDVVRYADSNGLDENVAHGNAWRYRDYVIAAFNRNLSYDQFIREQLAGDLLPAKDPITRNHQLTATGFLVLGPKVLAEVDEQKMEMDILDEQVDTLGKAFLGLTLGCARCHDHKFDPISMRDYYALAGIFKSTHTMDSFTKIARWHEHELFDEAYQQAKADHEREAAEQQSRIDALLVSGEADLRNALPEGATLPEKPEDAFPQATRDELARLREELAVFLKEAPAAPMAMGVCEGEPVDVAVHVRGSHLTLSDVVPRNVPKVLGSITIPEDGSGRLELAEWMTSDASGLTAQVMVNRIWRWHFGRGLVTTTDNFGELGARPTHPELLDWLSATFIENDWSIKAIHREILLSRTYRMSDRHDPAAASVDPGNRLYWRARIRRLEAEEIRDAMLGVAGRLDLSPGGAPLDIANRTHIFDHTSRDATQYATLRRSVFLPVIRNHLHDSFTLFDYTDATVPVGDRNTSTVPSQALYLMNSDFAQECAQALADRLKGEGAANSRERIERLYLLAFGRPVRESELTRAEAFLASADEGGEKGGDPHFSWMLLCQAVLMANEFVYIR